MLKKYHLPGRKSLDKKKKRFLEKHVYIIISSMEQLTIFQKIYHQTPKNLKKIIVFFQREKGPKQVATLLWQ